MDGVRVAGIVLAAGAGTRFGGPKALAVDADGVAWIARVSDALKHGGCSDVVVVLGAGAAAATALVPEGARVVVAEDWAEGLSHSLRAGLTAATGPAAAEAAVAAAVVPLAAVVIAPVDVPDLAPAAVARVIGAAGGDPRRALVRATYDGAPGHPVLVGSSHIAALAATLQGDTGAGAYLARHSALPVECADLWSGHDIDR